MTWNSRPFPFLITPKVFFLATALSLGSLAEAQDVTRKADLWVHYKLDDGSGTTAKDETSNAFDGTLVGMTDAAWVDGKFGKALSFDGQADGKGNDRVKIPLGANVGFHGYTVSLWFKTGFNHTNAGMLYFGSPDAANGFGTQNEFHINMVQNANTLQFWGMGGLDQKTTPAFNDDAWHNAVAVMEPGNFIL